MLARSLIAMSALALFLNVGVTGTAKTDDAKNIQGNWKLHAIDGKDTPAPEDFPKIRFRISPDKLITILNGKDVQAWPYKLNPSKQPKHIDLIVEVLDDQKSKVVKSTQTRLAIYELGDDELKICVDTTGDKLPDSAVRPTEFKASGNLVVMKLKRDK